MIFQYTKELISSYNITVCCKLLKSKVQCYATVGYTNQKCKSEAKGIQGITPNLWLMLQSIPLETQPP